MEIHAVTLRKVKCQFAHLLRKIFYKMDKEIGQNIAEIITHEHIDYSCVGRQCPSLSFSDLQQIRLFSHRLPEDSSKQINQCFIATLPQVGHSCQIGHQPIAIKLKERIKRDGKAYVHHQCQILQQFIVSIKIKSQYNDKQIGLKVYSGKIDYATLTTGKFPSSRHVRIKHWKIKIKSKTDSTMSNAKIPASSCMPELMK